MSDHIREGDDAEDDYTEPTAAKPVWRRPWVWGIFAVALAIAGYYAWKGELAGAPPAGPEPPPPPASIRAENTYEPVVKAEVEPPPKLPPAQKDTPPPPVTDSPPPAKPPAVQQQSWNFGNLVPSVPGNKPPAFVTFPVRRPAPAGAPGGPGAEPERTAFAPKATQIPGALASAPQDGSLMLEPGLLAIVIDTVVDSSSGSKSSDWLGHTLGATKSSTGVTLIEANSKVIGTFGQINDGATRMESTGTWVWTRNQVWASLDAAPGVDSMGRAGWAGEIDRRIPERFGAATLLMLTDQTMQILQAMASKGDNTYLNFNSSGGSIQTLIQEILSQTRNLKPIFRRHQGEPAAIFIRTPIFFRDSYTLVPTSGAAPKR